MRWGALYHPDDPVRNTPPPPKGILLTFTVSAGCNVTVTENAVRGGVVLEDPTKDPIVYAPSLLGVLPPRGSVYGGGSWSPPVSGINKPPAGLIVLAG